MKEQQFNSLMPKYNEKWAAKVLKMKRINSKNIDLIDDLKGVETKFAIVPSKKNYYKWISLEYQIDYPKEEGKPCFWGLGLYYFNTSVQKTKPSENLEKYVDYREMMIVNWNWIKQFPPSNTSGKTELSEWDLDLRYPKFSCLPDIGKELKVEGGKIFFAKDIDLQYFENLFTNSPAYYEETCPF